LNTINLDAKEKIVLRSPKIELGYEAETAGEPLIRGTQFTIQFSKLIASLNESAKLMKDIAAITNDDANEKIVASFQKIRDAAKILEETTNRIKVAIDSGKILSEHTYTL
jgi:hypothetical protein